MKARSLFEAAVALERAGRWDDARLAYELSFDVALPHPPSSLFLNIGLLARKSEDLGRAGACLRAYLERRPDAPEAGSIRTFLASLPSSVVRPCVTKAERSRARRAAAKEGAKIDGWVESAVRAKLSR